MSGSAPRLCPALWIGALSLVLSGCVCHVHLLGTVEDQATAQPLSGIHVHLEGAETEVETDSWGEFEVDAICQRAPHTVVVSAPGYEDLREEVTLRRHEEWRTFRLQPVGKGPTATPTVAQAAPPKRQARPPRSSSRVEHQHPHRPRREPAASGPPNRVAPRPPTAPKRATGVIAQALARAFKSDAVARLTTPRAYLATHHGQATVVTVSGETSSAGLRISLEYESPAGGSSSRFRYSFGPAGTLLGLVVEEDGQEWRVSIEGSVATCQAYRSGASVGAPRSVHWGPDTALLRLLTFVVPCLQDQGLPQTVTWKLARDEHFARGAIAPLTARLSRERVPHPSGARSLHTLDLVPEPTQILVLAEGKEAGRILEVRVFEEGAAEPHYVYRAITPQELRTVRKEAPLLANEKAAERALLAIQFGQERFKRRHGAFAASLKELAAAVYLEKTTVDGTSRGYSLRFRRSSSGGAWMAIAAPDALGETGRYYLALGQEGELHRSETPMALNDACKLPR